MYMRKMISVLGAWMLVLVFAAVAMAQGTGRINGEILDKDGKPLANATITLKLPETGQTFTEKTDKNGKFVQLGLKGGVYVVTLPDFNYSEKYQVKDDQENEYKLNLKELIASGAAANPDAAKKKEEEADKFKNMKVHFDAGVAAMAQANDLKTQMKSAPADQKATLQSQRTTACQTAATEFQQAEQGVTEKDVGNHAMILGNLGAASECAGKYPEAAAAFQKASDLKPNASYYVGLATNLANVGAATTDATAAAGKFTDASAACDKAVALDAATGATCWKNLGIVLSNKGRMKEAVAPLQKASQADPKDQLTWYMLGSALTATIDTKQEGDKMTYIIPPGTSDAYQKCIDIGADTPLGKQCKEALDGLVAMGGGLDTSVGKKKKK
ncbi:MAG: carboxypeptidase regulatory-like domain-containing protein [Candidatus Acidiferrales bacterium]